MDKIKEFLTRGVSAIFPNEEALEFALKTGKKLRIYNGIDPTGSLHIGHMVVLKKLRQAQLLGHEIIVLIGDFTAQIGDPTDKKATRKKLTREQVEQNAKSYKKLVGKILDVNHADMKFLHNEEWSNKLKPVDMLELASHFTVQQLIERDMFQQRLKAGKEIYLHEFLYPIFQAYDCVTMDVDMEVGGNDQTFNMLAGRTLMKKVKNKDKFVLATKLLTDPTGKKMGKTEGNVINLDDSAKEIFGKVMAFPDELICIGFELLTDKPMDEIKTLEGNLNKVVNPRNAKAELAYDIVSQLKGNSEAEKAKENFEKVFSRGELPEDIREFQASKKQLKDILVDSKLAISKSESRRLIEQGAVKVDKQMIKDVEFSISPGEHIISVGKRNFIKVRIDD